MSIYHSQATLQNNTASVVVVGTLSIPAGSAVTYWDTTGSYVPPTVMQIFQGLLDNQAALAGYVQDATLSSIQDGIVLTYDQHLHLFDQMVESWQESNNLSKFTILSKMGPTNTEGSPIVVPAPREGDEWVVGSHNFSDPCTWFGDSVRVSEETLSTSDDLTFSSAHPNWIDMVSGRQHNDRMWAYLQTQMHPEDPHGYSVIVHVDGVEATPRAPFATDGGDYEILWDEGQVRFFSAQTGKVVKASYSYATTSVFYVRTRRPDYALVVEDAEADISLDTIMNDDVVYAVWAMNPETGEYEQYAEYGYSRTAQLVTEGRGSYPVFQALCSSEADRALPLSEFRRKSRGMRVGRQAIPFNYSTVRELPPGAEIRISLRNNHVCGGEHVSMTLYCTEKKL